MSYGRQCGILGVKFMPIRITQPLVFQKHFRTSSDGNKTAHTDNPFWKCPESGVPTARPWTSKPESQVAKPKFAATTMRRIFTTVKRVNGRHWHVGWSVEDAVESGTTAAGYRSISPPARIGAPRAWAPLLSSPPLINTALREL